MRKLTKYTTHYHKLPINEVRNMAFSRSLVEANEAKTELLHRFIMENSRQEVEISEAVAIAELFIEEGNCTNESRCLSHLVLFKNLLSNCDINKASQHLRIAFATIRSDLYSMSTNIVRYLIFSEKYENFHTALQQFAMEIADVYEIKNDIESAAVYYAFSSILSKRYDKDDKEDDLVKKRRKFYERGDTYVQLSEADKISRTVIQFSSKLSTFYDFTSCSEENAWNLFSYSTTSSHRLAALKFFKTFSHFNILEATEYENIILAITTTRGLSPIDQDQLELNNEAFCFLANVLFATDSKKALFYLDKVTNFDDKSKLLMELALQKDETYHVAISFYSKLAREFTETIIRVFPGDYISMCQTLLRAAERSNSPLIFNIYKDFKSLLRYASETLNKVNNSEKVDDNLVHLKDDLENFANLQDKEEVLTVKYALLSCIFLFRKYEQDRSSTTLISDFFRYVGIVIGDKLYDEDVKIKNIITSLENSVSTIDEEKDNYAEVLNNFKRAMVEAKLALLDDDDREALPNRRRLFKMIDDILQEAEIIIEPQLTGGESVLGNNARTA